MKYIVSVGVGVGWGGGDGLLDVLEGSGGSGVVLLDYFVSGVDGEGELGDHLLVSLGAEGG